MTNEELEAHLRRQEAEAQRAEEPGELFWRRLALGTRSAHEAAQRRRTRRRRWAWSLAPLGALAALVLLGVRAHRVERPDAVEAVSGAPRLGGAPDEDDLLDGLSDSQLQALAARLRNG